MQPGAARPLISAAAVVAVAARVAAEEVALSHPPPTCFRPSCCSSSWPGLFGYSGAGKFA